MKSRTIAAIATAGLLALGVAASAAAATKPAKATAAPAPGAKDSATQSKDDAMKPAGPKLQMGEAPAKSPGKDRDLRHCLDLPTTAEVIKCTEKK